MAGFRQLNFSVPEQEKKRESAIKFSYSSGSGKVDVIPQIFTSHKSGGGHETQNHHFRLVNKGADTIFPDFA